MRGDQHNEKIEKAKIILRELNEEYTIPSYMEEYALKGIITGLSKIEQSLGIPSDCFEEQEEKNENEK